MALYRVNRRILFDWRAYNPGSEIELSSKQAAQFRNGQITMVPPPPESVEETGPEAAPPQSESVEETGPVQAGADKETDPAL